MILTAQQVKDKLKIGDTRLKRLAESGKLKPVNQRKPGAKKFYAKYNSKDVNAAAKELGLNGQAPRPRAAAEPQGGGDGLMSRLARIEATVDAIAKALL